MNKDIPKNIVKLVLRTFSLIGHVIISAVSSLIKLIKLAMSTAKKKISSVKIKINPSKIIKFTPKIKKNKKVKSSNDAWVPQYTKIESSRNFTSMLFGIKMFFLGVLFTIVFILVPSHLYLWLSELPNPDLLITKDNPTPSRILDKEGRLLYEIYIDKRYEPVKINAIPDYMVKATIAVEDDQFYNHHGFDPESILRAAKSTLFQDSLQGGSTITQQLVKNVLLTPERTISRKLKELFLAVAAEATFSKDQIMELYLNNISYGGSAWGVQSAAQKFYGKNIWELDLAEASLLAGLPSAPSAYSPLTGDFSAAKRRQKFVLERMYQLGYITKDESTRAYEEPLQFSPQTEYIRAPHFVAYVRQELENIYGKRFVELGGLTIRTTLDLDLQNKVQQIVAEEVSANAALQISNGASTVIDVKNGGILAYVGSVDYFKEGWGAYDVASAFRQPGSSIKPLTYALALEKGYTPASIIKDSPVTYQSVGQAAYTPKNYDGKYHGDVTLRAALANSYNIPAVNLARSLGPDNIVKLGQEFGLSNWQVDGSYGLSITLGGKEVKLLEHTNFYASLARGGIFKKTTPFISIKDNNGFEIYKDDRNERQVVSADTAYLIWHILSDNNARVPAFGYRNSLVIPNKKVAVKTGTTDNIRDNFTMGYTPSFAVGVWVGNNDNTPLNRNLSSGLSGAAPIWNRIMSQVLENVPDEQMSKPDSVFVKYDKGCNRSEIFIKGSKVPESLCPKDDKEEDKKEDKKD